MPQEKVDQVLNGQFQTSSSHNTGIGLENLRKRLELYFGTRYRFEIHSKPSEGTKVIIEIPLVHHLGDDHHV
ncbi:hypothetical protein D3C85_1812800 [compost metagenome]